MTLHDDQIDKPWSSGKRFITFLEELSTPIGEIDGGCPCCINSFLDVVNPLLADYDLPYQYEYNEDDYNNPVSFCQISPPSQE